VPRPRENGSPAMAAERHPATLPGRTRSGQSNVPQIPANGELALLEAPHTTEVKPLAHDPTLSLPAAPHRTLPARGAPPARADRQRCSEQIDRFGLIFSMPPRTGQAPRPRPASPGRETDPGDPACKSCCRCGERQLGRRGFKSLKLEIEDQLPASD